MPSVPLAQPRDMIVPRVHPTHARHFSIERWLPPLILLPSLIAIVIFVYGFIGSTVFVSLPAPPWSVTAKLDREASMRVSPVPARAPS